MKCMYLPVNLLLAVFMALPLAASGSTESIDPRNIDPSNLYRPGASPL